MPEHALGKTVAIVQARLGSSRLPMKSLLCLHGYPIIDWVTQRLSTSRLLDKIIVATPDTPMDAVLREHLRSRNIAAMSGSENDVLSRFCDAARLTQADTVVRVCADNPLIWGEAIDRLLLFYAVTRCDYAYNHIPRNNLWPDGLGAEVLSAKLLFPPSMPHRPTGAAAFSGTHRAAVNPCLWSFMPTCSSRNSTVPLLLY